MESEAIRDAGITDFGIVWGTRGEEIKAAVGDGSAFGIRVTYIHQQDAPGPGPRVKVSEPFLKDDTFVMFWGNNLIKDASPRW